MTDIRKRKGKLLSEMDMSIDHEKATYDMVMLITEGCRGQMRFRDEFKAIFGFKGKRSNGGYVGVRPEPRITITHDVMDNTQPYLYKEPTNVNKILNIGQFYGSAEYITRAIIAHNIAHAIIETPYLHIKKEYRTNGKISGHHSS